MTEAEIKQTLVDLIDAIEQSDGQTLTDCMARLDELVARQPSPLPPQLAHFLGNRSYAKALLFVEGESGIPRGVCGGGKGKMP